MTNLTAIILAGGYAKRLWPLTTNTPKPLLSIAGRPLLDHVVALLTPIRSLLSRTVVLTNRRFEPAFRQWAQAHSSLGIEVVHDGSFTEEEKPGAVGALAAFAPQLQEDFLVLAGDCLLLDPLTDFLAYYKAKQVPVIALYRTDDKELARRGSIATINAQGCLTSFVEKPAHPTSDLLGAVLYAFPLRIRERLLEYQRLSLPRDEPGHFIQWLHRQEPVYGHLLQHPVWDIGTPAAYAQAHQFLTTNHLSTAGQPIQPGRR